MVYNLLGKNLGVLIRSTILTVGIHHCRLASAQLGGIMKLYSDRGNPLLLRILAARNLSGVPLTVHFINDDGMSAFFCVCELKMKVKCAIASQSILPLFVPCSIYLTCTDMLIFTSSCLLVERVQFASPTRHFAGGSD